MVRQVIEMYDRDGKFIDSINSEYLLENPEIEHFVQLDGYYEDESMQVQQLIIELTGKCNLRCKYCIYNDYYEGNRDFNTSDISFETAKKAIDYAYAHRHPDHFSITFYGISSAPVTRSCSAYIRHIRLVCFPDIKATSS